MQELLSYVQMTREDEARLRTLGALVDANLVAVSHAFYAAIDANPDAAAVISGPAQRERLIATLQGWMREMLAGPYDDAYKARRLNIGRVHVRVGLPQRYVLTAMNVLRTQLGTLADQLLDHKEAIATRDALSKIMDIELAIMLETYINERERVEAGEVRALIFAHLPVTALVLDQQNLVVDAHRRHPAVFRSTQMVGYPIMDVVDPEFAHLARLEQQIQRARSSQNAIVVTRVDVGDASYRVTIIPVDRVYARLVIHIEDLTDAIASESRRNQEVSLIQLGTMAATVAHEIRNPLAGISGTIQIVERSFPEGDKQRIALGKVQAQVVRLGELVGDLLQFSRPVQAHVATVALNEVADRAASAFVGEGEKRASVTGTGQAVADGELLHQVLANLIANAWQAGATQVQLRVEGRCLFVLDDGPGLPADTNVFEPFVTTRIRGTGLGLPQAARCVEAMGGELRVCESELGGAGFVLELLAAA